MSVQREKKIEPAREYESTVSVTCDICGTVSKTAREDAEGVNWGDSYSDIDATGLYIKLGYNCPSGGSLETIQYHVCPECMKGKVFPFVEQLAGKKPGPAYEVNW